MDMPVVEVAVGLAAVYLMLAILCSSALEMVSGFLDLRGEMLWRGVESMLGGKGAGGPMDRLRGIAGAARGNYVTSADGAVQPLSSALLAHPLVASMRNGERVPSYLGGERFSAALLDTLSIAYRGGQRLQADLAGAVGALPEGPLKRNLELVLDEAGGDVVAARKRIEDWYDDVMQRVSGWYKRQAQVLLLALGFVAAVGLNIDSIELAKRMWRDPMLRAVAVRSAQDYAPQADAKADAAARAQAARQQLEAFGAAGLPIGWPAPWLDAQHAEPFLAFLGSLLGWTITALAVSLGAPYWHELLLKLLPMARNAGAKPGAPRAAPDSVPPSAPRPVPAAPAAATAPAIPFRNALNAYETTLTGDDVREIQAELGLTGHEVTGNLDQKTREAIAAAQGARGLAQDGELGTNLVAELLRKRRSG